MKTNLRHILGTCLVVAGIGTPVVSIFITLGSVSPPGILVFSLVCVVFGYLLVEDLSA